MTKITNEHPTGAHPTGTTPSTTSDISTTPTTATTTSTPPPTKTIPLVPAPALSPLPVQTSASTSTTTTQPTTTQPTTQPTTTQPTTTQPTTTQPPPPTTQPIPTLTTHPIPTPPVHQPTPISPKRGSLLPDLTPHFPLLHPFLPKETFTNPSSRSSSVNPNDTLPPTPTPGPETQPAPYPPQMRIPESRPSTHIPSPTAGDKLNKLPSGVEGSYGAVRRSGEVHQGGYKQDEGAMEKTEEKGGEETLLGKLGKWVEGINSKIVDTAIAGDVKGKGKE